jgi:hypothetical protein
MVRFIDRRVGIQARIAHDPVDEVIHGHRDAIDTSEALVERTLSWLER